MLLQATPWSKGFFEPLSVLLPLLGTCSSAQVQLPMRLIKLAAFTHNNPCRCLRASPLSATMSKRQKETDKKREEEDKEAEATKKPKAKDVAPAANAAAVDKIARRKEAMAKGLGEIQAKYYSPEVVLVAKTKVKEVGFSFLSSCFLRLHTMLLGWVPSMQQAQAE
jgi:hypothetical protein